MKVLDVAEKGTLITRLDASASPDHRHASGRREPH